MILYHGSTMEVSQPRILHSEIGRDFGFAFYTTDIQPQAERWARRRAMIESRRTKKEVLPIVSVYEWDEDAAKQLRFLQFDGASMDWLELVVACRSRTDYAHGYDIVEGKIANDNVGETVSYVMQEIMRKEDAIERLRFEQINNQIAFCTEAALRTLHFQNSYLCGSVNP
jgi:hypothetical protein rflaF_04467